MSPFAAIGEGGFSALDLALAEAFASIWPESDAASLHLAALTSWAVSQGHSCFTRDLLQAWPATDDADSRATGERAVDALLREGDWPQAPFIGNAASGLPIVVEGGRAWLRRYWRYEREIEAALRARSAAHAELPDSERVREVLDRLLPPSAQAETDWQRVAAVLALRSPLTVICGGPGTGKTFTALRILVLILSLAQIPLRMGLAAPTGKAAQRLSESMREGSLKLPLTDAQRAVLPDDAMTLHRLLGFHPQAVLPARDATHPLDLDVLVVDECSMVDLPLMAKLLRALKPECRLILLGDPDQLPAVENGAVLASLAAANESTRYREATSTWISHASASRLTPDETVSPIGECIVRLERPQRFGGDSGIARLVRAIRVGDVDRVFDALTGSDDIVWNVQPWRPASSETRQALRQSHAGLSAAASPHAALALLDGYRILCALREGAHGVAGINHAVASALHGALASQDFIAGRPIIVTSNQPALGLYNGDVGVVMGEHPGAPLRAWFTRRDGSLQALLPAQLPSHESAYAMTVHRAQGSEFDTVELVLPPQAHPLLTREWFYTAASRARRQLYIHASPEVIAAALMQRTRRINGLEFSGDDVPSE
jgi:exodeoxyribonuclease V alpha subunit